MARSALEPKLKMLPGAARGRPQPAQLMLDAAPIPLLLIEKGGLILQYNPAACAWLGPLSDPPTGQNLWQLLEGSAADPEPSTPGRPPLGSLRNLTLAGQQVDLQCSPAAAGTDQCVVVITSAAERQRAEQRISRLVGYDNLTGLPNRSLLADRLQQALVLSRRKGEKLAVLQLDLDHFKDINNSLGYSFGDALLQLIGQRLGGMVRQTDTVARVGSDEYAILLNGISSDQQVAGVARKLLGQLRQPFLLEERQLYLSCSLGVAMYPEDGETVEGLLKGAEQAMGLAKAAGGDSYRFFSEELDAQATRNLQLANDLHRAIELNQLQVHYQPQINLKSGRISGVEALLRWSHPKFGAVSPAQFIPLAEENGTIRQLGEWVLRQACRQAKDWQLRQEGLRMAVNISPSQFRLADFDQLIAQVLAETELDPAQLELEITESMLMHDVDRTRQLLQRIKQQGVSLAIDDFGTGYSSLGYLRHFPVDRLKIDRSFVSEIEECRENAAIVQAVISLASNLGQEVVAEGVETEGQLNFLRQQGCEEVQGFYFWRPQEANALSALL